MDIQKLLNQASEYGMAAISTAVEELKRQGQQAEREEDTACQAYFADVEEREAKVKQRLADLAQQEEEIKRKITAMQPGLVDATVSGDTGTFNRIQADLTNLEVQRATVATQMQLLSTAALPGNLELYKAAEVKAEARRKTIEQCKADLESIQDFVYDQVKAWDNLKRELGYISFYTPALNHRGREFTDVSTHFRDHRPISQS